MQHTRDARPWLRRRRRADRSRDRPREERDLPHRRRRRPRHDGARDQDDVRHAARRSVARAVRHAAGARGAGRARRARRRRRRPASSARSARTSRCSIPPRATTARRRARSHPRWRRSSKIRVAGREVRASCARSAHPQAQFLWAIFRDLFHYSAFHLRGDRRQRARRRPRDPLGLRLAAGPFETWQAAGWQRGRGAGSPRTSPPARRSPACRCPAWVTRRQGRGGAAACTRRAGRLFAAARRVRAALDAAGLPPPALSRSGAGRALRRRARRSSRPTRVRMWHLGDDVGIVSFKTKAATRSARTCSTACCARSTRPSAQCAGLVHLADEGAVLARRQPGGARAGDRRRGSGTRSRRWSPSSSRRRCGCATASCRRSRAVRGMALGGSCEFILHCDRTVAALESYIGLVEAGVGLAAGRRRQQGVRRARGGGSAARRQRQPARPVPVHAHVFPDDRDGDGRARARSRRRSWATCGRPTSS